MKLVLFPDTNIFIEAKDLSELPWEELASQEIRLLVCPPVRAEIDEHKTSSKNRVSERAKKWNPQFKRLLKPGATPLILREASPRVSVEIAPKRRLEASIDSRLDLNKRDDELVDCTLRYRSSNPAEDVRLFTDDTGPIGTAYELNLPFIDLPADWRRESALSEAEKENQRLKQKLKLLEANQPMPVIRILDGHGKEIENVEFAIYRCQNLTNGEIESLIQELKQRDPPLTAEALKSIYPPGQQSPLGMWQPPSDQRISNYLNEEYPAWIAEIRDILFKFSANLKCESLVGTFKLALSNEGVCPAFSTKFMVEASGGLSLLKTKVEPANIFSKPKIPKRPLPPQGRFVNSLTEVMEQAALRSLHSGIMHPLDLVPTPHDKNAWYQKKEEGESHYTAQKVLTCDEWRHHEKVFEETVWFKVDDNCASGPIGAVILGLHAQNLPEPVKRRIGFHATVKDVNVVEEARKFLRLA